MKKGFTFIEMIATMVILGVISLIATPMILNQLEKRKEDLYEIQINNIELALKSWANDNKESLPEKSGETITLTLLQLKQSKFIDSNIVNPITNKLLPDDMTLTITKNKNSYIYEVNENTGTQAVFEETDYNKPKIILKGEALVYLELGDMYLEPGVIAYGSKGNIIDDVQMTITGKDNIIKTDSVGHYTINYMVEEDGLISSINRTIVVRDTTPPVLIVPANVSISADILEFDLLDGVSAGDNSGQDVKITTKSNLSFGIPGIYTVIYTATDIYENSVSIKRIITVNE